MAPSAIQETLKIVPEDLDPRFAALKAKLVDPQKQEAVVASWKRLLKALEKENQKIIENGTAYVPTVEWKDIVANDYELPASASSEFKTKGSMMVKGVIEKNQVDQWFDELVTFCKEHPETAGYTFPNPTSWYNLFWCKPQSEARSHPNIQRLFKAFAHQFHVSDKEKLIDLDTQIIYGDRIRIRKPGAAASLSLHLDSSSIERWEDDNYRATYKEIFDGHWEDWDPFRLDERAYAKEDLYEDAGTARPTICSSFRTLQGWLALSDNKTGEGTLKVIPNLKLVMAYIILRPLFWDDPKSGDIDDYHIDVTTPKFPGAEPSYGQLYLNDDLYPHIKQAKTCVGIPDVNRGDFVFWHCDVCHEVDKEYPITDENAHSSVFYYGQTPLSIANICTLLETRRSFLNNKSPLDYASQQSAEEKERDFQGANIHDLKNESALKSMGLLEFDENEPGITNGQRKIREIANKALKEGKFDPEPYLNGKK
ncbi:DUF1479-domain-containing protein [Hyphopichia burtonii NRRL Y-1933]|uniref:DUF1479-domain-containing protein n=1 Tax=Hyphopichia burtonii NRRL Y-1933 TaxID=984485 RepID=A0A1E4RIP6_9ASCO|nr:DUF1479-domain-containing protein [Hyphopichia burtonii NRRL Y-1933]ODV67138.1 DUF1479-domain-containing protein [Hyphopichia burtonii NRRL Y-1933]